MLSGGPAVDRDPGPSGEKASLRWRRRIAVAVGVSVWRGAAHTGAVLPAARPARHGVERIRDLAYTESGRAEHRLDVYRRPDATGPRPIVLYVHGGAFRSLSKNTHWLMGLAYARRGYLVFNASYRLAPRHRFPAAVEDVCAAYRWVVANAERWGGDTSRLVLAGESAGANLVTAVAIATCYRRPEPWARSVWETGLVPSVVLPACGMFEVSNVERFLRHKKLPWWVSDQLVACADGYLPREASSVSLDLADPLTVFERGDRPDRPLPPFFMPVGMRDPLIDDTRRLHAALASLGVTSRARYYPGEVHAFHGLIWRPAARECWRETFAFIDEHLPR